LRSRIDGVDNYAQQVRDFYQQDVMKNWKLPEAEDDSDRKLLADVASRGWHIVGVDADATGPAFAFSVGFCFTLQKPEFIIMGLQHQVAAHLINDIGDALRSGMNIEASKQYDDVAADYPLAFVEMDQRYYREYLGYALWFYRTLDFPVLQCVWPDKAGLFPWDAGYDSRFFDAQRVLGQWNPC
jgi:hypothetical protein